MRVRIRLSHGPRIQAKNRKNQHVALALASLLTPAAVAACVLAFWRLTADFKATGAFPIANGLFSHWQVWLAGAATLQAASILLNRYGNSQPVLRKSVKEPERELVNSGSSN
ncbi:MAG TPA: hypothetical protein VIX89_10445 [Bryobacteraceae bacterium]